MIAYEPVIQKFQDNARKNATSFLPQHKLTYFLTNMLFKAVPQSFISNKMGKSSDLPIDKNIF